MLSTALKAKILDSFGKVKPGKLWADAVLLFAANAHTKTDGDIVSMLLSLRDQNKDNPAVMKENLGDQYDFLMTINFQR